MDVRTDLLIRLLEDIADGSLEPREALRRLDGFPTDSLDIARLDRHRTLRLGQPEAILCAGKEDEHLIAICDRLACRGDGFLATRADERQLELLERRFPDAVVSRSGRIVHLPPDDPPRPTVRGQVLIVSAGTSDLPVAEEARVTAVAGGQPVEVHPDVGVAGLHRILALREELRRAAVLIVVAGMDGALPSVVAGLVPVPVIAVPTSRGYGASLGGFAALLAMLTSCAPGLTVVNIDNGYGAACAAMRINRLPGTEA